MDLDIDITADLNAQDDDGLGWSTLADAREPTRVRALLVGLLDVTVLDVAESPSWLRAPGMGLYALPEGAARTRRSPPEVVERRRCGSGRHVITGWPRPCQTTHVGVRY